MSEPVLESADGFSRIRVDCTANKFLAAYRQTSRLTVAETLPHHVALIALARVEGVSPVNYLDQSAQDRLVALTKLALLDSGMSFEKLFEGASQ